MTAHISFWFRLVTIMGLLLLAPLSLFAGEDDRFKGWAWSPNIGWISFNCSNTDSCDTVDYGVTIAVNNIDVSGWAWSDNVGWIDFSNASFNSATGIVSGTVSAIAGTVGNTEPDGWTGDIILYDTAPVAYGVDVQLDNEALGYAWGDVVVGWISFNCENQNTCGTVDYQVYVEPFYFNFSADVGETEDDKVTYNGSVTLTWTTNGATSCTASGGGATGWASPSGKSAGEPAPGSNTFSSMTTDTTFSLTCEDSLGRTVTRDLPIYVAPPAPSLTFYADDFNVPFNTSTILRWDALYIDSCTATGEWSGSKPVGAGRSASTGNLTGLENYFNLTCTSIDTSAYPDPVFQQVLVNVEKLTLDFGLDSNNQPFADPTVLQWTSTFANDCTASGGPGTTWTAPSSKGVVTDQAYTETVYKAGTTDPLDTGSYTFTMTCNGTDSQQIVTSATLKVGRNPNFSEEIGNNPDNQ